MEMKVQYEAASNFEPKLPSCLFNQIQKLSPGMIIGFEFETYADELTQMKAHVSTLFALLYLYGQKQHKEIMIEEIKKKMPSTMGFSMEQKQQYYECVKKMKQAESMQKCSKGKDKNKNEVCQIFVLSFLLKELKRNIGCGVIKKIKVYNDAELQLLKWSFLYIFEQEIQKTLTFDALTITKMLTKILGITCTTKNYYEFEVIELNCELFNEKNIEIFIETSKELKIRRFIKQKNIQKIQNQRRKNTKTIQEKLGCQNKCQNPEIMTAFKGNNSFIYQAAGNTSFEQILRVEDSIQVDDDEEEYSYEQENSIQSVQINGSQIGQEPAREVNKMIKGKVYGEEVGVEGGQDEEQLMDESVAYSRNDEVEESQIEESIVYNKSKQKSQQSYMQQSVIISHEDRSGYKIGVEDVQQSFVEELKVDERTMQQKGSQSCSSGKNKANTRESQKHNLDCNENRKCQFMTEEQMKIISIKSDEIRSPYKGVDEPLLDKLYVSNSILTKNEVLSEDQEFFTSKIEQIDCLNDGDNFCRNEKFEESLIINEGVNDLDFEESNQQFFEGISIIEQQKSMNCTAKIGEKKISDKSTATDESSQKQKKKIVQNKRKLNFNKIPAQNLLRETWILQYLDQIQKGEISFEYEQQQVSQCYSVQLESDNEMEEKQKESDENLGKLVVNWVNKVERSNKDIEMKQGFYGNQNGLQFVRGVLGALLGEVKQEKIAKFIENVRWRVNNRNKAMVRRGENIEMYPQEFDSSILKSEQAIKNVLNKKVGSFNPEKCTNYSNTLQKPKKTMLTSICQELKSSYEMLQRMEKKSVKSQILQISRIDNEGLSMKSRQSRVQVQSYFTQ